MDFPKAKPSWSGGWSSGSRLATNILTTAPSRRRSRCCGAGMSPTHSRGRQGQRYRYYVSQSVLKGSAADGPAIARISAAEIEGAVIAQVRGLLRQPEVVLGAWRAARASAPDMTEDEARLALERLDPLWEELFPAEQARIIHLLVDRVDIGPDGADVRLKLDGLVSLVRDLGTPPAEFARAAA